MAQKYYTTAETATVLGKTTDQIKQMLERRELHGYRDGADWKFKVEDIDKIAKEAPPPAHEDGGDVLLSEAELGKSDHGLSGTVIGLNGGKQAPADSDIRLAESDIAMGALGEESKTPAPAKKDGSSPKQGKFEDLELALDDSTAQIESSPTMAAGLSHVDIAGRDQDEDVVLGGSGIGSDVSLGGDSGISLVDPADSGFSLETPVNLDAAASAAGEALVLGEDDLLAPGGSGASAATLLKTDDDFQLTPLEEAADAESESGSQVIALDAEGDDASTMIGAASLGGASMAAMLDEDLSAQPSLEAGMGMGAPLAPSSVLGVQPGMEGAALSHAAAVPYETPYTAWQLVALGACVVLLIFCGIMIFDLMRNMWGWDQPYSINSKLMDSILNLLEKK